MVSKYENVGLEFHFWLFLGVSVGLEFLHLAEAEDAGEDVVGEGADILVINGYLIVELVTGFVDAVFRAFQLRLKVHETLVGF